MSNKSFPYPLFSYLIRTLYFNEANITFASSPWGRAIQLHSRYGTHSETTAFLAMRTKTDFFYPRGPFLVIVHMSLTSIPC